MSLKLNSSGGGSVTLQEPSTANNQTLTLPDNTGTILTTATPGVPVNGPAFYAYQSSAQSVSGATTTKVQFQTELFDTANCFDSTTNYRFTPTVAGYYQFNAGVSVGGATQLQIANIYKNGAIATQGMDSTASQSAVSALLYLNGSTDYVEVYFYTTNAKTIDALAPRTYFSGYLARAA